MYLAMSYQCPFYIPLDGCLSPATYLVVVVFKSIAFSGKLKLKMHTNQVQGMHTTQIHSGLYNVLNFKFDLAETLVTYLLNVYHSSVLEIKDFLKKHAAKRRLKLTRRRRCFSFFFFSFIVFFFFAYNWHWHYWLQTPKSRRPDRQLVSFLIRE